MSPGTSEQVVACQLGSRPHVLVAAVKALTFRGIRVRGFVLEGEGDASTGCFLTDDPELALDALHNAGLDATLSEREVTWSCHPAG